MKELSLPDKPSKPLQALGDYSMLLYGREKIGKTDLAAQFPDAFFLMCEPGGKSQRIFQRYVTKWKDFKGYIDLLLQNPEKYKTVVVDTVDLAYKMCVRYVNNKLGIDHVSEEKWGKSYDMVKDEFTEQMQRLLSSGRGVIFISHEEDKSLPGKDETEKTRVIPTMPKQARKVIEPMVDIWAYYSYTDDGSRSLRIRGTKYISAGCRLKENFVGVSKIPMGESAEEGFKNFVAAFHQTQAPKSTGNKISIRRK